MTWLGFFTLQTIPDPFVGILGHCTFKTSQESLTPPAQLGPLTCIWEVLIIQCLDANLKSTLAPDVYALCTFPSSLQMAMIITTVY